MSQSNKKPTKKNSINIYNKNQLIYTLFTRKEYEECLQIIEQENHNESESMEYPNFIKALIILRQGKLNESLDLLKTCYMINNKNIDLIKQISNILFILGKFKSSLDLSKQALQMKSADWEIYYTMGLNYQSLKDYPQAIESLKQALSFSKNDKIFMQLGKILCLKNDIVNAISIYKEALKYSIQNSDIMTIIGLLHLRLNQNQDAFYYFGNALSYDQKNPQSILALGSIIQDQNEYEMALIKYRVAILRNPNSSQLWNNIGMCYYGKNNSIAAISCLKRALYLEPFEWIIVYNLGLIHMNIQQYASAFHFFSVSIQFNPNFSSSYLYMGIALNRMGDYDNARKACERAVQLEEEQAQNGKQKDFLIYLNYAIILAQKKEERQQAKEIYQEFLKLYSNQEQEEINEKRTEKINIDVQKNNLQRLLYDF